MADWKEIPPTETQLAELFRLREQNADLITRLEAAERALQDGELSNATLVVREALKGQP